MRFDIFYTHSKIIQLQIISLFDLANLYLCFQPVSDNVKPNAASVLAVKDPLTKQAVNQKEDDESVKVK